MKNIFVDSVISIYETKFTTHRTEIAGLPLHGDSL